MVLRMRVVWLGFLLGFLFTDALALSWSDENQNGSSNVVQDLFCSVPSLEMPGDYGVTADQNFSFPKMFFFSKLAKIAYHPKHAQSKLLALGFQDFVHLSDRKSSFSGYLARRDGHAYLSISGTFDLKDVIQDTKFQQQHDPLGLIPGRLHLGFMEGVQSVWDDLKSALQMPAFQGLPISLTGHSLGAASALLLASRLHASGHLVHQVFAFASPRVGNREFATWYDQELGDITYRVVRGVDLVPRVPPESADIGDFLDLFPDFKRPQLKRLLFANTYMHVGQVYTFESTEVYLMPRWPISGDHAYWSWLKTLLRGNRVPLAVLNSIEAGLHHVPEGYVCHAARMLERVSAL